MEMNNTTQSKDRLTPEEAKVLMEQMEATNQKRGTTATCRIITANRDEVIPQDVEAGNVDITALKVLEAPEIKDATFKKAQKDDSFEAVAGTQINRSGARILTDAEMGRTEKVAEVPENETQRASREQAAVEKSAAEKYEQNNEGDR